MTTANSSLFKYKSSLLGNPTVDGGNAIWKNAKIMIPLKYVGNLFRSLELPLINTELYLQLNWTKDSVISDATGITTFKITKTALYVPVVTLKTENNNKLNQLLDTDFERIVYWNEYKSKIETVTQVQNINDFKRTLLDISIPGVNRLFAVGFNDNENNADNRAYPNRVERDSHRKYSLPRVDIKDYNVSFNGRNFYDQNISDDFKKYKELRKSMTGKGKDYTTRSLLDYDYYKKHYKLVCCDLS